MPICKVCLAPQEECFCPECVTCGKVGDPKCYRDHVMLLNKDQCISRAIGAIVMLQQQLTEQLEKIEMLKQAPDSYTESGKHV